MTIYFSWNITNKHTLVMLLLFTWLLFSCNSERSNTKTKEHERTTEIAFDKSKWHLKKGVDYLYRNQMLNDIVYNDTIRSLSENEIIGLLGEPDRRNNEYLYYQIKQKRLFNWPLHTKTMVIKLSKSDSIDWIKIHE